MTQKLECKLENQWRPIGYVVHDALDAVQTKS